MSASRRWFESDDTKSLILCEPETYNQFLTDCAERQPYTDFYTALGSAATISIPTSPNSTESELPMNTGNSLIDTADIIVIDPETFYSDLGRYIANHLDPVRDENKMYVIYGMTER